MLRTLTELLNGQKQFKIGILYIKPKGSIESASPNINEVPEMSLDFTPSELALESVKDVAVAADITETNEVYDMSLRSSNAGARTAYVSIAWEKEHSKEWGGKVQGSCC